MTNPPQTIRLYDEIRQTLMDQGMPYWEAFQKLYEIDSAILEAVTNAGLKKLDPKQALDIYDELDNLDPNKLAQALNISAENLVTFHQQKLLEYLNSLKTPNPEPNQAPNEPTELPDHSTLSTTPAEKT